MTTDTEATNTDELHMAWFVCGACQMGSNVSLLTSSFYAFYSAWCAEYQLPKMTNERLAFLLIDFGFEIKDGRVYGLSLRADHTFRLDDTAVALKKLGRETRTFTPQYGDHA